MARIEINLPAKWLFTTGIPIRIGDINRGSHLSHVALVAILEEARAQFLVSLGYADEVNIQKGIGFILGDVGIVYKSQAHYGQIINVEIAVADLREKSFDLVYRLSDSSQNIEIARAKTGLLVFDYQLQKVVPLPEELKKQLIY
jgi:acyl-CoA thioester hydrolase